MDIRAWVLGLGVTAVIAGRPDAASAADEPLLVAVEAGPDVDADPAEIRRAISVEVHLAAVAPTARESETAARALVIGVDRNHIAVALRDRYAPPVVRVIPAPADHAARVRAISWLAGNLVRDQVSAIVDTAAAPTTPAPAEPSPLRALPPRTLEGAPPPTASPPAALEPPAFEMPAATIAIHGESRNSRATGWTIGVAAGPEFSTYETGHALRQSIVGSWNFRTSAADIYRNDGTLWRIEARHHTGGSTLFSGFALEGSSSEFMNEIVGATAIVGTARQRRPWSFEASVAAGVDLGYRIVLSERRESVSDSEVLRPGLFAAASLAVAHTLSESMDVVLSLDFHQSVVDEYDGFFGSTLGLRYHL
jgi:hypothetical protein